MTNRTIDNFSGNFAGAVVEHKQEYKKNTVVGRQENNFY